MYVPNLTVFNSRPLRASLSKSIKRFNVHAAKLFVYHRSTKYTISKFLLGTVTSHLGVPDVEHVLFQCSRSFKVKWKFLLNSTICQETFRAIDEMAENLFRTRTQINKNFWRHLDGLVTLVVKWRFNTTLIENNLFFSSGHGLIKRTIM